jgi:hypothetical protein
VESRPPGGVTHSMCWVSSVHGVRRTAVVEGVLIVFDERSVNACTAGASGHAHPDSAVNDGVLESKTPLRAQGLTQGRRQESPAFGSQH